jgi:hypothetical protein
MKTYDEAVAQFILEYRKPLMLLFGSPGKDFSADDLKVMLEYSIGNQMRTMFEFKGRLDAQVLTELRLVPRESRVFPKTRRALERAEIGKVQNKPMDKVVGLQHANGEFLRQHLEKWRLAKMRIEMRKLAQAANEIENDTRRLMASIEHFRRHPSKENRLGVSRAIVGLNKSLLAIHYRARSAGAWAIRAGFTPQAASRALEHLYLKRVHRLGASLNRLDRWLEANTFKSRLSEGVERRQMIIEAELHRATGIDFSILPKARYPKPIDRLPGLDNG